jgi:hypothetical protein
MPETLEEFTRRTFGEIFKTLPVEERLEFLQTFPPEERERTHAGGAGGADQADARERRASAPDLNAAAFSRVKGLDERRLTR